MVECCDSLSVCGRFNLLYVVITLLAATMRPSEWGSINIIYLLCVGYCEALGVPAYVD